MLHGPSAATECKKHTSSGSSAGAGLLSSLPASWNPGESGHELNVPCCLVVLSTLCCEACRLVRSLSELVPLLVLVLIAPLVEVGEGTLGPVPSWLPRGDTGGPELVRPRGEAGAPELVGLRGGAGASEQVWPCTGNAGEQLGLAIGNVRMCDSVGIDRPRR